MSNLDQRKNELISLFEEMIERIKAANNVGVESDCKIKDLSMSDSQNKWIKYSLIWLMDEKEG